MENIMIKVKITIQPNTLKTLRINFMIKRCRRGNHYLNQKKLRIFLNIKEQMIVYYLIEIQNLNVK